MPTKASAHITQEDRLNRIQEACGFLADHLKLDNPSIALPADFRWAVATEARECVACPGCADLKEGKACGLKEEGHGEHSIMKKVEHTSSPNIPFSITDRASWNKIRNTIHFMVHHPHRADAKWYQETIKSLGHASIIGKKDVVDEAHRERLVQTLFAEIAAVVLASHGLLVTYIAMGTKAPPLPPLTQDDLDAKPLQPPTFQDAVTAGMLKKNRGFRTGEYSDTPYCLAKDINRKSPAFQNLSPACRAYCLASMNIPHPLAMLSVAPQSMHTCAHVASLIMFPEDSVGAPWQKLDPARFRTTSTGFDRADHERVCLATADKYKAAFCQEFHRAVLLGLALAETNDEREAIMVVLAQTAIHKPHDPESLQKVVQKVEKEYGDGTLLEVAASVGYGEIISRGAKLAGMKPLPRGVYWVFPKIIKVMKCFA